MVFKKAFGNTFANALAIIAVVGSWSASHVLEKRKAGWQSRL
jgi:hypothetical protein